MEGNKDLTQESAEILTIRGTAPVDNGTKFLSVLVTEIHTIGPGVNVFLNVVIKFKK